MIKKDIEIQAAKFENSNLYNLAALRHENVAC